ncbi:MAG: mechanosensitive ion channel [Saprospiraceae bacterium]|nr:mechanosensitive ion channel [Saprospiraceae bacterium]
MEQFLNYKLVEIGKLVLSVYHITGLIILILVTGLALWVVRKSVYRSNRFNEGKKYSIYQIIKYLLIVIVVAVGLNFVGVDVTVFVAGSAALLVGLGLGVQNLFNDFISGIIILFDSTVKVGDVIEVNGVVGQVMHIELRTTTIRTREDTYIILPNSYLTGNQLSNWTHENVTSRFDVKVGVDYSSDVDLVMKLIADAAKGHPAVKHNPEPKTQFVNYGDSSVDFRVLFYSDEVFRIETIKSEIRVKIWHKFKEHGISIPFPQRTIHFANQPPAPPQE